VSGPIWFGVSKWSDAPEEKTFDRVTESRLYYRDRGRDRFENKHTIYKRWYPTREEAQAAIDTRIANAGERKRMNLIRDAAPDLLEAAEAAEKLIDDMSRFVGQMALKDYALFNEAPILLRGAIAKARGEVA
jgi:hypothetical protein